MSAALRPLTTGQLLDKTFQIYRQNFGVFAGISALPHACTLLLQLCLLGVVLGPGSSGHRVGATLFVSLLMLLVSSIMSSIALAATTFGVSDNYLEEPTTISSCFGRAKGKILRVIWVSFKFGMALGIGFILLIIPGLYVAGKYGLCTPAVVLEDIDSSKAFKRSAQLTQGSTGRILTIYFLVWVLILVIGVALQAVIAAAAPSLAKTTGSTAATVIQYVLSALTNMLITPIQAIALTLAYYDQRVRKEAFDIESMMNLLGMGSAKGEMTPAL